jgi:hypothetical protein
MRKSMVLGALVLASAAPVRAQTYSTGDTARHAALGGGGIALPGSHVSTEVNPAALASSPRLRLLMPRLNAGFQGEKGEALLRNVAKHGDLDHILEVGPELFRGRTVDWVSGSQAIRFAHFEIGIGAGGQLAGTPNASLRKWAQPDIPFGLPPASARFNTEYGYYGMVPIAFGHRFALEGSGLLDVGIRLIPAWGAYHKDILRVTRAGAIKHKITDDQKDFGVGADLGLRFAPKRLPDTTFGLVARGLSEGAIGKLRDVRTVDAGVAHQFNSRLLGVVDWLNIPSAGNRASKGSVGAEYTVLGRWLTVRGAVTTRGLAAGIGIGPFNFGYSADGQSIMGTGFSF